MSVRERNTCSLKHKDRCSIKKCLFWWTSTNSESSEQKECIPVLLQSVHNLNVFQRVRNLFSNKYHDLSGSPEFTLYTVHSGSNRIFRLKKFHKRPFMSYKMQNYKTFSLQCGIEFPSVELEKKIQMSNAKSYKTAF